MNTFKVKARKEILNHVFYFFSRFRFFIKIPIFERKSITIIVIKVISKQLARQQSCDAVFVIHF